mmetsp:Transcript_149297/g.479385  ORF Transcript_149297/g.479385 Transcript_149297/m.479385 type:complete len:219 (-) Transcript_149297:3173-3829(-)
MWTTRRIGHCPLARPWSRRTRATRPSPRFCGPTSARGRHAASIARTNRTTGSGRRRTKLRPRWRSAKACASRPLGAKESSGARKGSDASSGPEPSARLFLRRGINVLTLPTRPSIHVPFLCSESGHWPSLRRAGSSCGAPGASCSPSPSPSGTLNDHHMHLPIQIILAAGSKARPARLAASRSGPATPSSCARTAACTSRRTAISSGPAPTRAATSKK